MDATTRIAFVGGGNMAQALVGGLVRGGHAAAAIRVVEPDAAQRERLARDFGVAAQPAADAALADAEVVVWAVKPQVFAAAAHACGGAVGGALQVSVMAGVRSAAVAAASGSGRVVRAMPNTPALIGHGIAGLWAGSAVRGDERAAVEALFAPTGAVLWVDREADLDAVTALSGSGPAYVFYVVEAMVRAGVELGLAADAARTLAVATVAGAAELARRSPLSPAELRAQVTSRGGTTHAAISVLEAANVGDHFVEAIRAAARRAAELGASPGG